MSFSCKNLLLIDFQIHLFILLLSLLPLLDIHLFSSYFLPLFRILDWIIVSTIVISSHSDFQFSSVQFRVFSNESTFCMRWPKYWSFSFSISPSNEHPGLISFRMDWLDLLAVQGILKSLLQHHSSKASILWCSAFFTVQLSHPYMTIGKTIALTRRTFVGKVVSLFFFFNFILFLNFT